MQDFLVHSENAARVVDPGGFQLIYTCFQAHQRLKGYALYRFKSPSLQALLFPRDERAKSSKKADDRKKLPMQREETLIDEIAFLVTQNHLAPSPNPQMRWKHIMAKASHSGEHPSKRLRLK